MRFLLHELRGQSTKDDERAWSPACLVELPVRLLYKVYSRPRASLADRPGLDPRRLRGRVDFGRRRFILAEIFLDGVLEIRLADHRTDAVALGLLL